MKMNFCGALYKDRDRVEILFSIPVKVLLRRREWFLSSVRLRRLRGQRQQLQDGGHVQGRVRREVARRRMRGAISPGRDAGGDFK